MQIKEEKVYEMVGNIMSGAMANPANAQMITDIYSITQATNSVLSGVRQGLMQAGVQIIEYKELQIEETEEIKFDT